MTTTPSSNGRPFRDDQCLAIMAIPGYSLINCAVLLWVAKRTLWGKAVCPALPSRIARELSGKIGIAPSSTVCGGLNATA